MDHQNPDMAAVVDVTAAARLARECAMADEARRLTHWVGPGGRPVTASGVVRRADVVAAGAAVGVTVPARVRSAADVTALHQPWSFAVGAGLVQVTGSRAVAGPALESWPVLEDGQLVDAWLAGVRAVFATGSDPRHERGAASVVLAFLEAVATRTEPDPRHLWRRLIEVVEELEAEEDHSGFDTYDPFDRFVDRGFADRLAEMVELLGRLGALTGGDVQTVAVSALGQWARAALRADRPRGVTAELPAGEVVELLAERVRQGVDPWPAAWRWLEPREAADAARELLRAATGVSAAARIGVVDVVDGLGEQALVVWREVEPEPWWGPHARATLFGWGQGPRPEPADVLWLAVERATAALEGPGPDEALAQVYDRIDGPDVHARLAAVAGCDHPDAERLADALAAFVASGAARSVDTVYQLTVSLMHWRPKIWRRVLVPATATLGDLHAVIQVLFGWDGDHLHMFEVADQRYSDPFFDLRDARVADEEAARLRAVFPGTSTKIVYEYDFGASWRHEVTLERVQEREAGTVYPVCTGFDHDSPVEYPSEEDPEDAEPFDLAATNLRLARIGSPVEADGADW